MEVAMEETEQVSAANERCGVSILHRTKLCMFYPYGLCTKGSKCTFAHQREELMATPDLFQTKMCKVVMEGKSCLNPKCRYAHSSEEVRGLHRAEKRRLHRNVLRTQELAKDGAPAMTSLPEVPSPPLKVSSPQAQNLQGVAPPLPATSNHRQGLPPPPPPPTATLAAGNRPPGLFDCQLGCLPQATTVSELRYQLEEVRSKIHQTLEDSEETPLPHNAAQGVPGISVSALHRQKHVQSALQCLRPSLVMIDRLQSQSITAPAEQKMSMADDIKTSLAAVAMHLEQAYTCQDSRDSRLNSNVIAADDDDDDAIFSILTADKLPDFYGDTEWAVGNDASRQTTAFESVIDSDMSRQTSSDQSWNKQVDAFAHYGIPSCLRGAGANSSESDEDGDKDAVVLTDISWTPKVSTESAGSIFEMSSALGLRCHIKNTFLDINDLEAPNRRHRKSHSVTAATRRSRSWDIIDVATLPLRQVTS
jgi:hypothetical protein